MGGWGRDGARGRRGRSFLFGLGLFAGSLVLGACAGERRVPLLTPLEREDYRRIPQSSEFSQFLSALVRSSPWARRRVIGFSAGGRPLELLLISRDRNYLRVREQEGPGVAGTARHASAKERDGAGAKLTIMLIGSQHGTEPSGAEAVLLFARDLLAGAFPQYLDAFDFLLVPNSNPDGRDRHRRVNANNVNLSTDYALLSQPESRAVNDTIRRWRPDVILDLHESAVFKRKSLGRQGFMTDFEAQFEIANNPNVDPGIQSLSRAALLPELLARVRAGGLPARHYIGEITDVGQPITHGGLSLRNLRNKAGLMGAFSFLVENRLDGPQGTYAKPRNIDRRVAKQYLCVREFLATCYAHRGEIAERVAAARRQEETASSEAVVYLQPRYVSAPSQPQIALGLRKVESGERVLVTFTYQGAIDKGQGLPLPDAYVITAHEGKVGALLRRHGIAFETVSRPARKDMPMECVAPSGSGPPKVDRKRYRLQLGDLLVSLRQPAGKLVPLLLEPASAGGPLGALLGGGAPDFFICRMRGARNAP